LATAMQGATAMQRNPQPKSLGFFQIEDDAKYVNHIFRQQQRKKELISIFTSSTLWELLTPSCHFQQLPLHLWLSTTARSSVSLLSAQVSWHLTKNP